VQVVVGEVVDGNRTWSVTRSTSSRASTSSVKCKPAVGAAADPASRA
jgi:hypothetical protein